MGVLVRRVWTITAVAGLLVIGAWQLIAGCEGCQKKAADQDQVDWEVQGIYQRGSRALADGKFTVAEAEFRKVLEQDGEHLGAMTKLARALHGRSDREPALRASLLDDALGLLDRAAKQEPDSEVVWSELAKVARKAGQYDRAIAALRKLLSLNPKSSQSVVAIAEIQEQRGSEQAAEQTLRSALGSDDGPAHLEYGRLLLRRGRADEARAIMEKIEACPGPKRNQKNCPTAAYYEARDELGALAVRQGRMADARRIYTSLVKMFPEDYMAWEVLAAMDEQEGKFKEAEQKYRQSLAVDRVHMSGWRGLGRSLAAQGRSDDALFAFRKADHYLAKSPDQALQMADELFDLGDPAWARSLLERGRILVQGDAGLEKAFDGKLEKMALRRKDRMPDGGGAGGDHP